MVKAAAPWPKGTIHTHQVSASQEIPVMWVLPVAPGLSDSVTGDRILSG